MKAFLIKVSLFISSLFLLYFGAHVATMPEKNELQNDFMAAMIDKHQRAEEIGSPKIVIAGGSNIAFNIDSERVQNELQLPVVNLGLNVGLGMDFILEELKDIAGQHDIVFIFMTYFEGLEGTYALRKHTIDHYPKARQYHRFNLNEEVAIHTRNTRNHVRNALVSLVVGRSTDSGPQFKEEESIYSRDYFNDFGDFEGHHGLDPASDLEQRFDFPYRYWEGIGALNDFLQFADESQIRAFYVFPAYPETEFQRNSEAIKRLETDIRNELKMPIIGSPETFLFGEEFFYDTIYHLTREGRERRTTILLEKIGQNEAVQNAVLSSREIRLSYQPEQHE